MTRLIIITDIVGIKIGLILGRFGIIVVLLLRLSTYLPLFGTAVLEPDFNLGKGELGLISDTLFICLTNEFIKFVLLFEIDYLFLGVR